MRPGRLINKLLRSFGYSLRQISYHTDDYLERRLLLMDGCNIDLIIDVGANTGQFALSMRKLGYRGRIASIEPLKAAFNDLRQTAASDSLWHCENYALGATEGIATINVSANSVSSSLLPLRRDSVKLEPSIGYVDTQEVEVKTLDNVFPHLVPVGASVFLKIDAQGLEKQILEGSREASNHISLMQIEVSLCSIYEGDSMMCEIVSYVNSLGFDPVSIEPGFSDKNTGQQFQADILFRRRPNGGL